MSIIGAACATTTRTLPTASAAATAATAATATISAGVRGDETARVLPTATPGPATPEIAIAKATALVTATVIGSPHRTAIATGQQAGQNRGNNRQSAQNRGGNRQSAQNRSGNRQSAQNRQRSGGQPRAAQRRSGGGGNAFAGVNRGGGNAFAAAIAAAPASRGTAASAAVVRLAVVAAHSAADAADAAADAAALEEAAMFRIRLLSWIIAGGCMLAASPSAQAQQKYASPEEAFNALVAAAKADDTRGLVAVLGKGGLRHRFVGDDVADRSRGRNFYPPTTSGTRSRPTAASPS
jgi:hypothetical protein